MGVLIPLFYCGRCCGSWPNTKHSNRRWQNRAGEVRKNFNAFGVLLDRNYVHHYTFIAESRLPFLGGEDLPLISWFLLEEAKQDHVLFLSGRQWSTSNLCQTRGVEDTLGYIRMYSGTKSSYFPPKRNSIRAFFQHCSTAHLAANGAPPPSASPRSHQLHPRTPALPPPPSPARNSLQTTGGSEDAARA